MPHMNLISLLSSDLEHGTLALDAIENASVVDWDILFGDDFYDLLRDYAARQSANIV